MDSYPPSSGPVKVLICGGSYAGLAAATNLTELCAGRPHKLSDFEHGFTGHEVPLEITIVDERDGFYHLIGSPLALADADYASRAWQRFSDIPRLQQPHLRFVHGSVVGVDCEIKRATIRLHDGQSSTQKDYDYLVAATGLRRVWPTVPQALSRRKYLTEAQEHIGHMRGASHGVVVVGGGAVGIEMAAELKLVAPSTRVTLIHSRDRLLSSELLSDNFRNQTLSLLRETGVEVITGERVLEVIAHESNNARTTVKLSDGSEVYADHVISAISKQTSTGGYLPQESLTSEGLVRIRDTLQLEEVVSNSACHFAIGDLVDRPGIKRCGGAMYTGSIAAFNIYQHILHERKIAEQLVYQPYPEHPPSIVLAMGKTAIGYSGAHWQETGGISKGEELCKLFFEDDLGLGICWRHIGLGDGAPGGAVDSPRAP